MKNKMHSWKKKNICASVMLAVVAAVFTPAAADAAEEGYRVIVDDFAGHCLQMDEASAKLDQVLEQIGDYFEGEAGLEETNALILDTKMEFQETLDRTLGEEYTVDDNLVQLLEANGIDPVEYEMYWPMFQNNLIDYIDDLEYMEFYFGIMEGPYNQAEEAKENYQCLIKIRELNRLFEYYSINYWFAEWEGEKLDYVKEAVLEHLTSFIEAPWENSRDAVELRVEACLNELEGYVDKMEQTVADLDKQILAMKKEMESE